MSRGIMGIQWGIIGGKIRNEMVSWDSDLVKRGKLLTTSNFGKKLDIDGLP